MAGLFPTRKQHFYRYMPLVSIVSLFWWIMGLALWIHFSQLAYNKSMDFIDIMQLKVYSGAISQINRVYQSIIGTAVTYTIFAVCIHALGIYRGVVESEQDKQGEVQELKPSIITISNVAVQIAWWVIVLWMIVMLAGFGSFAAYIYVVRTAMADSTVSIQACISLLSTGVFVYSTANDQMTLCICDKETIFSGYNAINEAWDAVPGMIVGLIFMIVYGVVLLAYVVGMLVRTSMEVGLSDRLSEQGFTSKAARRAQ